MDQLRQVGRSRRCSGLVGDDCQFVADASANWLTIQPALADRGAWQIILASEFCTTCRRWMLAADVPYSSALA